jgi:uncharacterized protein (TIGR02217 family)
MPITVLTDVILPENLIAAGIRGKNVRNNARSISGSGFASININWSRTLRQYQLGIKPMFVEDWQQIEALHEVTEGGAFGFLMEDPKDSACGVNQGFLQGWLDGFETGDLGKGAGVPSYKLRKQYASFNNARAKNRPITRPKPQITVRRNNAAAVIGTAAGNISVDYETGTVTFVADATQAIQAITTGSTTVLEFADDTGMVAAMSVSGRVYITGVTGTAATALNGKSHLVLSKLGNTITIQTNTATLEATGGTAAKYPQPSDNLNWHGGFYVPVHFANDDIDWDLLLGGTQEGRIVAGQSVLLQEIRE